MNDHLADPTCLALREAIDAPPRPSNRPSPRRKLVRLVRVIRRHPEWVRTCGDCSKWVMNAQGQFVTFGLDDQRIPQTAPPCWSCPKQPDHIPSDKRKPLPLAADFGPWLRGLLNWFDAGRAVGFGEVSPLMREVAAVLMREKEAGEAERMREAVVEGVRRAMGRR